MASLFSPLTLRGVTMRNRIGVSPMCQYSAADGFPNEWHVVHLGSRAVGGAGLVCVEATGVAAAGRISPHDLGIWSDLHLASFARLASVIRENGAVPAIQLAHAGRKASTEAPWNGGGALSPGAGGWQTVAPSAIAFREGEPVPVALTAGEIDELVEQFTAATRRSLDAGFDIIEIHAAHGYLLHQFLSPLSNKREDAYGGALANRMRLPLRVANAVRGEMPDDKPLFVRISSTDWVDGGWDLAQSIEFARELKKIGVDVIDASSGGAVSYAKIPLAPGYQVEFAREIRRQSGIATAAVGLITEPEQANAVITSGDADIVLLARAMLRDPYWPMHAATVLGAEIDWPRQYLRAK